MGQEFRRGDALFFHHFNRGKRSLELDLTSKLDRTRLDALATQADFFVHNVKPGTDVKLGIDGPSMVARHPRLIHASISAFGAVGPLAKRPGYEPLIQAYSGLSSLNGDESDPPIRSAASLCDQGTAMWVTIGMLSLLHRRNATGKGGIVQGSLLETALMWGGQKADELVNTGKLPEKHRSGHPMMCPYEAFDASDGPILICAGNDRLFARVAEACGRPDWVTDERFATNRARLRNKPALFAELRPILASKPREHWLSVLQRLGVPASPINSLAEVLQEPQVRELGVQQAVPGEDFALTGMPFTIDGERPRIAGGAPRLGEH
ncbi:L-carnitine dehydratase/bile acid-inducible protein F [Hyaloraphidium curvatum]|nr:L-carnitine dehydratase/bile acid-inducible protein F [Hyaloraphidium curvatum]